MSLSDVQRSDDNYRRNSFEDRICDDLTEVLLQFLSTEDKLRFECVSKQFQRTVYQRQYDLNSFMISSQMKIDLGRNFAQILEKLMKKLPNIRSLNYYIRSDSCPPLIDDSDIDIIVKYCHNLSEIKIN